jgi:hypothetical protein
MTRFIIAALTVTAFIWAITEPQYLQDLTLLHGTKLSAGCWNVLVVAGSAAEEIA